MSLSFFHTAARQLRILTGFPIKLSHPSAGIIGSPRLPVYPSALLW